jgi:hypothetical protein
MPEIWLPYGKDEIVINIKAEYLSSVVESTEKHLDAEELAFDNVEYADVVLHDGSKQSKVILDLLNKKWESQGKQARMIEVDPLDFNSNQVSDASEHTLVDGSMVKIPSFLLKSKVLVISSFSFDPLFGFYGPHILLTSYGGLLREAVKRWDRKLNPGGDPDSGWFAMRFAKSIPDLRVIAFLKGPRGILEFRYGEVEAVLSKMKEYLKSKRSVEFQQTRFTIIGAGGDPADRTLAGSILSLSNNLEVATEDAEIILVAECSDGLGSPYLRSIVDGAQLSRDSSAWEETMLENISSRGKVHLVSTLPKAIVERRLKMKAYSSLREAFEAVQSSHGWRFKAGVITDSSSFHATKPNENKE